MNNLFEKLKEDEKYKQLTENLDDNQKEKLEEYMKVFMENLEKGIVQPFSLIASNQDAKKEFSKLWKSKNKESLTNLLNKK